MRKFEIQEKYNLSNKHLRNLVIDGHISVDKSNPMIHQYTVINEDFMNSYTPESYETFLKERTKKRKSDAMYTYMEEHSEHKTLISKKTSEALKSKSDVLSIRTKEMWKNQEIRNKILKSREDYWKDEEHRKKQSERIAQNWVTYRESMLEGTHKRWESPDEHERMSEILTNAYKNPEVRKRVSKGVKESYKRDGKGIYEKRIETRKKNNTFISSFPQDTYRDWLLSTGLTIEEEKPYPSEPTCHCDWYIKELDLWIEGHFSQFHLNEPFDKNNPNHIEHLHYLEQKHKELQKDSNDKTQYSNSIYQWTNLDVRKRACIEKDKINLIWFYDVDEFDYYFSSFNYHGTIIRPWDNYKKILDSFQDKKSIYARDCYIKEVPLQESKDFLNKYHYQNATHSSPINIGLYYDTELVQIMTFGKPRYNRNYQYELLRLCTKFGHRVIGGASRLLSYFEKIYKPESLISYCDKDKFDGSIYSILGFTKLSEQKSKHWWSYVERKHFTDSLLRQRGVDQLLGTNYGKGTSNEFLMKKHGFYTILDNGQATYIKLY